MYHQTLEDLFCEGWRAFVEVYPELALEAKHRLEPFHYSAATTQVFKNMEATIHALVEQAKRHDNDIAEHGDHEFMVYQDYTNPSFVVVLARKTERNKK